MGVRSDIIAGIAMLIAAGAAVLGFKQYRIMEDQEYRQLRPYLQVVDVTLTEWIKEEPFLSYEIHFKDFGLTPALHLTFDVSRSVQKDVITGHFDDPKLYVSRASGQWTIMPSEEKLLLGDTTFSGESASMISSPGNAFVLHGTASYEDTFSVQHSFNFCFFAKSSELDVLPDSADRRHFSLCSNPQTMD